MTTPLLQLQDLNVTYAVGDKDVPAVRGVDLTLDPGGTLGVAGESGSGKSTVAMSVLRLLPRTAKITGEILLDGEDVTAMKWGRLRAVRWAEASVVFQGAMHALNPVRKIGEQIAEPLRLHPPAGKTALTDAEVDARVTELLTQVDLPPSRAGAYPHELSGGQKQRVMIAMALACSPRLIIADEPTTALDVIVQAQVLALLSRLVAEQRIGLVMISHDLSVLAATCERIAVMYDGQIVEEGPSAEVMGSPKHEHTRALAAAFPTVGDPVSRFAPATSNPLPPEPPDRVVGGEPLLAAENLRVSFRDRTGKRIDAVAGVDLTVSRDEIVALVGQSGSGKTTLARTLLGLQKPDSGVVRYAGKPVPTGGAGLKAYRRQVQLVLQDPTSALNPAHTVYEAVAEGPRIHQLGDERAVVHRALEAAELRPAEKYADRLPHQLSGGQRQRVVIAGALALEPSVVVADEPVASLDASVRGEILGLLLRLRRELGLAGLVITHDLGLAWNIADRVAVMYRGELVETGTVEQVLLDPQHEYTKSLLAALPGGTAQRRTVET
ncbi:ABC transporter ATP-binding protein [Amycolatopsis sp. H6(2020)]|nr:ABC transporter ATP-binding protein [Amycolatopsis sp. H6(2020)]